MSAVLLYVLPFYYPKLIWWGVFVFPIPLFLYTASYSVSFLYGYLFGFFSLMLHLQGVFKAVFYMGQGGWFYKLLPFLFNVTYHAFFAGLFFWLGAYFCRIFNLHNKRFARIMFNCFALYAFIMYIDLFCLMPFGRCEGYFLMNPLVPLASVPPLLYVLLFLGRAVATFLVLLVSALTAMLLCVHVMALFLWLVSLGFLFFFIKNSFNYRVDESDWYKNIVAMPMAFAPQYNLTFLTSRVADIIKSHLAMHPETRLFIMPESSFYCEHLAMPALSTLWGHKIVGQKVHVLAGAFRWKDDRYFNSIHWVYDGVLQKCFDKRHAMVLTERLPSFLQYPFWQRLFFGNRSQITPSVKDKKYIMLDDNVKLVPYICSELFFNYYPDDSFQTMPIVAMCNDYLLLGYVADLMFLAAIFQAIAWQRTIVYVSFVYHAVILSNGDIVSLNKVE